MQRNFVRLTAAALFLTAIFLGTLAKPASADVLGLVSLINSYRQSTGLSALTEDQNLVNAACWLSNDMADKGYFDHTDSLGRTMAQRLSAFGVSGGYRAENIADLVNQTNSAQKIFDMWKGSSGHNANMLDSNFSRIGVATSYRTENKTYYWTADFASESAVTFNNQCGVAVNPTPTPQPTTIPNPTPTPPTPKQKIEPTQEAVQIATPAPTVESVVDEATKSASPSSLLVKFDNNEDQKFVIIRFLGLATFLLANCILFSFVLFKVFRRFKVRGLSS